MTQQLITANDIKDGAITDSKIATGSIASTKISAPITGANFSNFNISLSKIQLTYMPNVLRNGGFDENTSFPHTGWSRGNILSVDTSGIGLSDTTEAGERQSGINSRAIKIIGPTSGNQYEVYQDVFLSAMGWGPIINPGTNGNYSIAASFTYKTNATALVQLSFPAYGSTVSFSNATTFSSTPIPWRSGITSAVTPGAPTGTPTITARISLGLNGGAGSYVYFDNISVFSTILG